jgi:signal transduction histidine kinase
MIDDLLLYSRLDMNQLPFSFEKVDILAYFSDYCQEAEGEPAGHGIPLKLRNEINHKVFILMDRERFGRVIQNIIDNSRKYMDKADGIIEIFLRETATSVIIEIRDNGPGIPENKLSKIFERFYRMDCSRKSTGGSGLGLAIARQLVEGHDGRIWAKSVLGEGTSILISLKKL